MNIPTTSTDRKQMAKAMAEYLGCACDYLRTPTYAYRVGNLLVERDGSITGERDDLEAVAEWLLTNNYIDAPLHTAEPEADADFEAPEETQPDTQESPADSETPLEDQVSRISVSVPLADCTPAQLINILRMLYARQTLIRAMTRCDYIRMDEEVITLLSEAQPESLETISEILQSEAAIDMVTGIAMEDGCLKLDTTYNKEHPTGWNSFAQLLIAATEKAKQAQRVNSKHIEPEDGEMKYFCRSWLIQLGMGGADFKATRASLLNHLHGYAAFRTADKMEAHRTKYAELRREFREDRAHDEHNA